MLNSGLNVHMDESFTIPLSFCLSDLVCICEWLLRSDSIRALVHRPVQRGKSVCIHTSVWVCDLLSPLHYCERKSVKTPPLSRSGKKLISRGTPASSFTAARVSAILKNLPLIYDRLSIRIPSVPRTMS